MTDVDRLTQKAEFYALREQCGLTRENAAALYDADTGRRLDAKNFKRWETDPAYWNPGDERTDELVGWMRAFHADYVARVECATTAALARLEAGTLVSPVRLRVYPNQQSYNYVTGARAEEQPFGYRNAVTYAVADRLRVQRVAVRFVWGGKQLPDGVESGNQDTAGRAD